MASYLSPNYNPNYYDTPVFEAPLDLAFRVSQQKQAQFNQGLEQVKQEYQSNLNLPVTSRVAIAKRDAFMQEADKKLRKVITADFSLQENINAASNIYKPITKDKDIAQDLYLTSQYKKGYSDLNFYKNRKLNDGEKYIDPYYSERYLNEGFDKLRSAENSSELQNVEARQFVRPVDFIGEWNKLAKDLKITDDGAQVYMTPAGVYMYKEKNGQRAVAGLLNLANSQLSPESRNYLNVVGKVAFGDETRRIAATFYNGDENMARDHISKEMMQTSKRNFSDLYNEADAMLKEKEKKLEKLKKVGMTMQNPDQDEQFNAVYRGTENEIKDLKNQINAISQRRDELDPNSTYGKSMGVSGKTRYQEVLDTYRMSPEQYFSSNLINSYTKSWAEGLAKSTYQFTIDENKGYIEGKKAETEFLKAQKELEEARFKVLKKQSDSDSDSENSKQGESGYIGYGGPDINANNTPDAYEKYHSQIKIMSNNVVNGNIKLAEQIMPRVAGSTSLLQKVKKMVTDGNGEYGIAGSSALTKEELSALNELEKQGLKVKDGKYTYENIYSALKDFSLSKVNEQINSDDPEKAASLLGLASDLKDQEAILNKAKDDDERIKREVIKDKTFDEVRSQDGSLLSKEEFLKAKTGYSSIEEAPRSAIKGLRNDGTTIVESPQKKVREAEEEYNKLKDKFNKKFVSTIRDAKQKFNFIEASGNDVRVGIQYPVATFGFQQKGINNTERIVTEMFNDANISRTENLSRANLENLGMTVEDIRVLGPKLRAAASELKEGDGYVDVLVVGSDNRKPEYRFKPSKEFLYRALSEDERKAIGAEKLDKLSTYGIAINNNLIDSDFEKQIQSEISVYQSVIENNGGIIDLDDYIDDKDFGAKVSKNVDNMYEFEIFAKNPDGSPIKTRRIYGIDKLDLAVKEARKGLYSLYIQYMKGSNRQNNVLTEQEFLKRMNNARQ